jgi:hypothetical protein
MTTIDAAVNHPVVESVLIRRIHKAVVVQSELLVGFTPAGDGPALMSIGEGWKSRHQTFRHFAAYEVVEVDPIFGVRLFKLIRDPDVVAKAREKKADESGHYVIGIAGSLEGSSCDCWGADATARWEMICKHRAAVWHLVESGHL